jgi:hypothetical protein
MPPHIIGMGAPFSSSYGSFGRRESPRVVLLRHALVVVTLGIVTGVPLTYALIRTVSSLHYGLSPGDPGTLYQPAVPMLFFVASLASYVLARRAP